MPSHSTDTSNLKNLMSRQTKILNQIRLKLKGLDRFLRNLVSNITQY